MMKYFRETASFPLPLPADHFFDTDGRSLADSHPDLTKGGSRFNPADPWLILAAEKYDYSIITEELIKSARTTMVRRKQRIDGIPDVCVARGLKPTISLRDLAIKEGWIT